MNDVVSASFPPWVADTLTTSADALVVHVLAPIEWVDPPAAPAKPLRTGGLTIMFIGAPACELPPDSNRLAFASVGVGPWRRTAVNRPPPAAEGGGRCGVRTLPWPDPAAAAPLRPAQPGETAAAQWADATADALARNHTTLAGVHPTAARWSATGPPPRCDQRRGLPGVPPRHGFPPGAGRQCLSHAFALPPRKRRPSHRSRSAAMALRACAAVLRPPNSANLPTGPTQASPAVAVAAAGTACAIHPRGCAALRARSAAGVPAASAGQFSPDLGGSAPNAQFRRGATARRRACDLEPRREARVRRGVRRPPYADR